MTDIIDTRNVGAISALTRAMANAIAPSNVGGASLQLQDLRITFDAPPPVAVLLGTADARVLRRTEQGVEVEAHLLNSHDPGHRPRACAGAQQRDRVRGIVGRDAGSGRPRHIRSRA